VPRSPSFLPFAVTLAAVGLYSLMDAVMKSAVLAAGAYSALLLRSAFGLALIAPVWLARHPSRPTPAALRLHLIRGVIAAAMAFTFFWGLARIPLAEAIALSFVAPLVALYLAAAVLGEQVHPRAIAASFAGLGGVAIIAFGRTHAGGWSEEAGWGTASILCSAMLYAWNLVLQRQQALVAGPLEVASFQNAVVGVVLLLFAPFAFTMPASETWPTIAAAAGLAVAAILLLTWAYARAQAQALVPLEYSGFLWAAMFGWLMFAEQVTLPVVAGAGLIVLACWIAAPRRHPEQVAL
jgi:S-adenosylmethionine uptake transporter